MNDEHSHQRYSPNELAFIRWLKEQGITAGSVSEIVGRTQFSIYSTNAKFHLMQQGKLNPQSGDFQLFGKADHFLGLVNRGMAPDMLAAWQQRLAHAQERLSSSVKKTYVASAPAFMEVMPLPPKTPTQRAFQMLYYVIVEYLYTHDKDTLKTEADKRKEFLTFLQHECLIDEEKHP